MLPGRLPAELFPQRDQILESESQKGSVTILRGLSLSFSLSPLWLYTAGGRQRGLAPPFCQRLLIIMMTMLMETDQPHYGSKYKQNKP